MWLQSNGGENISRNILGSDLTTKLNYEAIGDTTTTALSLNATTHLFGNKFIKLSNKVTAKQDDGSASSASTSSDVDVLQSLHRNVILEGMMRAFYLMILITLGLTFQHKPQRSKKCA